MARKFLTIDVASGDPRVLLDGVLEAIYTTESVDMGDDRAVTATSGTVEP
jgi:hypothetical protein